MYRYVRVFSSQILFVLIFVRLLYYVSRYVFVLCHFRSSASTSLYTSRSTLPLVYPSDPASVYSNHPALSHSQSQPSLSHARITPPGSQRCSLMLASPPILHHDETESFEYSDATGNNSNPLTPAAVQLPTRPGVRNISVSPLRRTPLGSSQNAAVRAFASSRGIRPPQRPPPPPPPPKPHENNSSSSRSAPSNAHQLPVVVQHSISTEIDQQVFVEQGNLLASTITTRDEEMKITTESKLREDRSDSVADMVGNKAPLKVDPSSFASENMESSSNCAPRSTKPFLLCKCGMRVRVDLFDVRCVCM